MLNLLAMFRAVFLKASASALVLGRRLQGMLVLPDVKK